MQARAPLKAGGRGSRRAQRCCETGDHKARRGSPDYPFWKQHANPSNTLCSYELNTGFKSAEGICPLLPLGASENWTFHRKQTVEGLWGPRNGSAGSARVCCWPHRPSPGAGEAGSLGTALGIDKNTPTKQELLFRSKVQERHLPGTRDPSPQLQRRVKGNTRGACDEVPSAHLIPAGAAGGPKSSNPGPRGEPGPWQQFAGRSARKNRRLKKDPGSCDIVCSGFSKKSFTTLRAHEDLKLNETTRRCHPETSEPTGKGFKAAMGK